MTDQGIQAVTERGSKLIELLVASERGVESGSMRICVTYPLRAGQRLVLRTAVDWDGDVLPGETNAMRDLLVSRGFRLGVDLLQFSFPEGLHDESSWADRIHLPFQFFFGRSWRAQRGES